MLKPLRHWEVSKSKAEQPPPLFASKQGENWALDFSFDLKAGS
jgi:hypothetical protein